MLWFCAAYRWRQLYQHFRLVKNIPSALMILIYSLETPPPHAAAAAASFLTLINTLFQSLTLKSGGEKAPRSVRPFWMDTYRKIFAFADFSVSLFWTRKGISYDSFINTPNSVRILYSTSANGIGCSGWWCSVPLYSHVDICVWRSRKSDQRWSVASKSTLMIFSNAVWIWS